MMVGVAVMLWSSDFETEEHVVLHVFNEIVEVAHAKFQCVVVDYGFLTSFQFIFISSALEQVEDETT